MSSVEQALQTFCNSLDSSKVTERKSFLNVLNMALRYAIRLGIVWTRGFVNEIPLMCELTELQIVSLPKAMYEICQATLEKQFYTNSEVLHPCWYIVGFVAMWHLLSRKITLLNTPVVHGPVQARCECSRWRQITSADCASSAAMELISDDAVSLLIARENGSLKLKPQKCGVHEINQLRATHGEYHPLLLQVKANKKQLMEYFRMTKETFYCILDKMEHRLLKNLCNFHQQMILLEKRPVVTLRLGKQWYPSFIEEGLHIPRHKWNVHCPAEIWHVDLPEVGAVPRAVKPP
ncbi:hypothetical protein PR048_021732 [Dryococelus australis]|uniref:Uncharacterized protein n=1 Tax=Dryococelus australis TaxID=614101 RepID=A0ABQ9GZ20_9NEOP|nr:hypothetical protein PR048_021732 [Dryococelus australis]